MILEENKLKIRILKTKADKQKYVTRVEDKSIIICIKRVSRRKEIIRY